MGFHKLKNIARPTRFVGAAALLFAAINAAAIECRYAVSNDWGSGFTADITVTNNTSTTINGWQVQWRQNGGSTVSSSWNAAVSGSNPYTARHVDWNRTIAPGASQTFGLQGNGEDSTATILGCTADGVSTTSSSVPRSSSAPSSMPRSSSSPRSSSVSSVPASSVSNSSIGNTIELTIQENTAGFCRVEGSVDSNNGDFTGTGFANAENATGRGIDWRVRAAASEYHTLTWRYANASGNNRAARVLVNGTAVANVGFTSTGAWNSWTVATATVALRAGDNSIRLESTTAEGLANIDSLMVTGNNPQPVACSGQTSSSSSLSSSSSSAGGSGYPLGNAPVPSAGCGRSPGIQSGTHRMTSAGLNREYIVSLPTNYNANVPNRLIFGMHWLNGSAEAVAGWSRWFGLKALDTRQNTIFVAPQGYTNGSPWRGGDNRDHIFFDDLNAHLGSNLCVDKSRIFSVGFSFGAMYTNALAQTHQNVLRGVVLYATADYNIYFPA
ncbi:MAG TPA: cellulose binding domain-containing protein, partial [Cellvibrio sp.]